MKRFICILISVLVIVMPIKFCNAAVGFGASLGFSNSPTLGKGFLMEMSVPLYMVDFGGYLSLPGGTATANCGGGVYLGYFFIQNPSWANKWSCAIDFNIGIGSYDLGGAHCKYHIHSANELNHCAVVVANTENRLNYGVQLKNIYWWKKGNMCDCGLYNVMGWNKFEGFICTFGIIFGSTTKSVNRPHRVKKHYNYNYQPRETYNSRDGVSLRAS